VVITGHYCESPMGCRLDPAVAGGVEECIDGEKQVPEDERLLVVM
jgi:hypothetical protein